MAKTKSVPPAAQRDLQQRLERHAATEWKEQCRGITLRFHGAFAYVDAIQGDNAPVHLCRLGYLGNPDRWTFAFYKYSTEKYERSFTMAGSFVASPEEAFDTAGCCYLQG